MLVQQEISNRDFYLKVYKIYVDVYSLISRKRHCNCNFIELSCISKWTRIRVSRAANYCEQYRFKLCTHIFLRLLLLRAMHRGNSFLDSPIFSRSSLQYFCCYIANWFSTVSIITWTSLYLTQNLFTASCSISPSLPCSWWAQWKKLS